jgi:glycosyltransferase involved in cell wall biosynthesis
MKISVYVPCFNRERHIAICLASLLAQTRRPDEIIVVDDGSTDKSVQIASAFPVKVIQHGINRGLATARNTGFNAATGDVVASIDDDCFAMPNWLDGLARVLAKNPTIVGVAGQLVEVNYRTLADRWRCHHMAQNHGSKIAVNPLFLHGANTMFRREPVLAIGGYNTELRTNGEDFDICARLQRANRKHGLIYHPNYLVMHLREDTLASVVRTRFRYLHYPSAVYTPINSLNRAWSRLRQITRSNWNGLLWDLRKSMFSLAPISLACIVCHAYWLVADYARNVAAARSKRAESDVTPSGPA